MGGISTKISPYIVGQNEFTNLVNVDFQMPGSLTKRWGSTMYVGTTLSTKITGLYEFDKATGFSQVMVVGQSTLFYQTGFSLTTAYNFFGFTNMIAGSNASLYIGSSYYSPGGATYILGGTFWYDFENYANYLWACNGKNIWKYDGASAYFFSLPVPISVGSTSFIGGSNVSGGMTGIYYYGAGYINNRGYQGPAVSIAGANTQGASGVILSWFNFGIPATTFGFDVGYGLTATAIYRAGPYATLTPANQLTFVQIGSVPLGGQTFVDSQIASSATLVPTSIGMYPEIYNGSLANRRDVFSPSAQTYDQFNFHPKYLELYNNQMFFSGFTPDPNLDPAVVSQFSQSTVVFSDIGEPESIQPENTFDVRTNDGDLLRGMKSYLSSLLLFKTNSFHRLSGQDPANFSLSEMSAQYGCISNRAICIAKNTCYFLDRKGIIAFNGANVDIISNKIDPIFARMNYSAALDQATLTYDKVRNELLCEIPIDGSATNNFTIVYDIIVQAWTTYQGINASSVTIAKGTLSNFSYLYGDYNGAIYNVGASYLSDNGTAYTALIQTRFFNEIDPATTKQWRRIFFNVDQVTGSTVQVNLIANYGSSVSITRIFQQTPYLSRIDFGIPSTALSFTLTNYSPTDTLRLHGFTMEYRFQRNVQDIE